jgi:hypothetical protein
MDEKQVREAIREAMMSQWVFLSEEQVKRERRERIAAAALQGMLANGWTGTHLPAKCVEWADALMVELDKEEK